MKSRTLNRLTIQEPLINILHVVSGGCPVVLASFVERTISTNEICFPHVIGNPHVIVLESMSKSTDRKCENLSLDFQFSSVNLYVYSCAGASCQNHNY